MRPVLALFIVALLFQAGAVVKSQKVENVPLLLDSYIPASMQVIAHITELLKYDLKPQSTGGTTTISTTAETTTTARTPPITNATPPPPLPTSFHKPAIFAPNPPLQISTHTSTVYQEYLDRLQRPNGEGYFDRYGARSLLDPDIYGQVPQQLELMVGRGPTDLIRLTNTIEREQVVVDDDRRVQDFSKIYDDSDFRLVLLKAQKKPPTRAYVGLLSLYDLLNKESKKLGLNKYGGYTNNILTHLAETSTGTSTEQLRIILSHISQRKDTKNPTILRRIDEMVKDLSESASYLAIALRYVPALNFSL